MKTFPHIPGIVGVKCLITNKDGKAVGEGHGSAILTRINKSIERTAFICLNSAFLSAANNMCKIWDSLRLDSIDEQQRVPNKRLGEAYKSTENNAYDSATPKQVEYLRRLIVNVFDDEERNSWENQISSFSREDASEAIQTLTRSR